MNLSSHSKLIISVFLCTIGIAILNAGGRDTWSVSLACILLSGNLILIALRMKKKDITFTFNPPLALSALLFLGFSLFIALYKGTFSVSVPFLMKLTVYYLAFISSFYFFDSSSKNKIFLAVLGAIGTLVALIGVILFLYRLYSEGAASAAATAFYVNKNHFAGLMEMLIPATAALLYFPFNKGEKSVVMYGLIIMTAALGFSMSRGGWISFSIAFITYLFLLFPILKNRGLALSSGVIVLIILLVISTFYFIGVTPLVNKYEATLDSEYLGMEGRVMIWENSFQAVKDRPGGWGPGMFQYFFQGYRPIGLMRRVAFAHNDFMHAAFELGIAGILFLILLIERSYNYLFSAFYYYSGKLKKQEFSPRQSFSHCMTRYGLLIGVIAMLTSITIHSIVDFNMHLAANGIVFSILLGMGMRVVREAVKYAKKEKPEPDGA